MAEKIESIERQDRSARRRVVITGTGALSPVGNTAPETWANLVAGKSGVSPVDPVRRHPRYSTKIAAEVKDFDPAQHIDAKEARRMARCSQLAIVAAREAVADCRARLQPRGPRAASRLRWARASVGSRSSSNRSAGSAAKAFVRVTPHQALESLCNMPGFHVSLDQGCLGPLTTIITACAAGTQAIGEGLQWIRRGAADVVLAGGTESQVTHAVLRRIRRAAGALDPQR